MVSNCDFTTRCSRTTTIKIKQQSAMNTDAPTTSTTMIWVSLTTTSSQFVTPVVRSGIASRPLIPLDRGQFR